MSRSHKLIIRAKTFRAWFEHNLKDSARDIANHGADGGFPYITYTSDTVAVFDRFADELWEMMADEAESMGENVGTFIGQFRRADMLATVDTFKNLVVWYACERVSREMTEKDD